MKKRSFNFNTKINKLKRRLKCFAEIISKKEKQVRESNAKKLGCSIEDIDKFYTEMKDPSKQANVFKGVRLTGSYRDRLYNINTWLEKIKTDGQEKALQSFLEFVRREQPLLGEYEKVFDSGVTPDGGGILWGVMTTPDGYNWEVWRVKTHEASRYLGGAFGDSVPKRDLVGASYSEGALKKQISYREYATEWCISWENPTKWKEHALKESFIFMIRQDKEKDIYRKLAFSISKQNNISGIWDAEDSQMTFLRYEYAGYILEKLEKIKRENE